jgi:hypothetical protein
MYVERMGLDPELAIVNNDSGVGRSAHMLLGDHCEQFSFHYDNGDGNMLGSEVSRDGPGVEVRTLVASACRDNLIPYLGEAIRWTSLKLEKDMENKFKLSSAAKYVLDDESLIDAPPNVSEFGCNPDIDAYSLSEKSPNLNPSDRRRWTGGHIHASPIGLADLEQQAALAILYDYFVAMPMVAILGNKFSDGEAERRQVYGQPGSFRYDAKISKIEFRTLSGRLLLHPTILGWCMGMVKSFIDGMHYHDPKSFLQDLVKRMPLELVYDTIVKHDVSAAEGLGAEVFKLLPNYKNDVYCLGNPMGSNGKSTENPYFYERAWDVFVRAQNEGLFWDDDMVFNWGLYEDYEIKHHAYWGIHTAMNGRCDDLIFPMNEILRSVWPKEALVDKPVYTHPTVGGLKKYVSPGAAKWLA